MKRLLPALAVLLLAAAAGSSQPSETPEERVTRQGDTESSRKVIDQFKALAPAEQFHALRESQINLIRGLLEVPKEHVLWDDWEQNETQGYARVLRRELTGAMSPEGHDGGGSFFSFGECTNDYQSTADLGCERGKFTSGFHGAGAVTRVGTGLRELTMDDVPAELTVTLDADFTALSRHLHTLSGEYWRSKDGVTQIAVGDTYVVRSIHNGVRDLLVGVQVWAEDDFGVTFAWKIIKTYPVPGR